MEGLTTISKCVFCPVKAWIQFMFTYLLTDDDFTNSRDLINLTWYNLTYLIKSSWSWLPCTLPQLFLIVQVLPTKTQVDLPKMVWMQCLGVSDVFFYQLFFRFSLDKYHGRDIIYYNFKTYFVVFGIILRLSVSLCLYVLCKND